MYKSYNYHDTYIHGGDLSSKSSIDEYIERVTRLQRIPSVVSDYPVEELDKHFEKNIHVNSDENRAHGPHKRARDVHKKVYFGEHEKAIEIERDEKREIYRGKTIDLKADGYIMQKHKNFEMCKFDTFKAN
ncbi:Unknown protein [Striga hermonthica]|uniref:Uncharacterized protein n=1 Tax=Striga hermonthica TaxID=68872 RepID=A0A9N7R9I3_STRHE|nr:Unknown protein [Striga hermonthica]